MSIRSALVALGVILVAVPRGACAQDNEADFVLARKQFVSGQPRQAANTLVVSSLAVRQQVGRCRDEDVGTRLMDAEAKLEKLAAAMRAGTLGGVKALDQSLTEIDRALAAHHLRLAQALMGRPRGDDFTTVARDIYKATYHFERSITLDGHDLTAEQTTAVGDAKKLSDEIDAKKAIPKEAKETLAALEKLLTTVTPANGAK